MQEAIVASLGLRIVGPEVSIGDVLQQQLGAARELDVLLDETIASMPDELRNGRGMRQFIKSAEASRVARHRHVRAALVSTRCTELLAQLGPAIDRYAWHRAHGSAAGRRTTQPITTRLSWISSITDFLGAPGFTSHG
jgi:hypothetical protein